jgi:ABC-type multidrug transport system ATPase subunit
MTCDWARASGQTVLFSTHYLEEADHNAHRFIVTQSGAQSQTAPPAGTGRGGQLLSTRPVRAVSSVVGPPE